MRIIIVGCGKVGSELAGQLSAAGHDLTLVDLSERRLEELSNTHDLATVKGSTLSTDTRTFDDNGNLVSMHQTDSDGYTSDTTYTQFK